MSEQDPVSQEMLHAYADDQLDPAEQMRVDAWLATHPADAASVHAYILQNRQLRQAFAGTAQEEIPSDLLDLVNQDKPATLQPSFPWKQMAAAILILITGVVTGWGLQVLDITESDGSSPALFASSAMGAHRVFVSEVRHPVEVPGSQQAHLVSWLSKRLGTKLKAPELDGLGYGLVGGRLLSEGDLPAAQFMYENSDGKRVTLYVRATEEREDTAFKFAKGDTVSAFYWIDRHYAYAMVAPLERTALTALATVAYRSLEEN